MELVQNNNENQSQNRSNYSFNLTSKKSDFDTPNFSINKFLEYNPSTQSGNNYQLFDNIFTVPSDSSISTPMQSNGSPALTSENTPRSVEQQDDSFRTATTLPHSPSNRFPNQIGLKMEGPDNLTRHQSLSTTMDLNKTYFQQVPSYIEPGSNNTGSSLSYPRSETLSYQSIPNETFNSQQYSHQPQLSQPRTSVHPQASLDMNSIQFQFPLNSTTTPSATTSNTTSQEHYLNQNGNTSHTTSASSAYTPGSLQSFGNSYFTTPSTQPLPQLNFSSSSSPGTSFSTQQPLSNQTNQQFMQYHQSNQFQPQNQALPHLSDFPYQPRSQSYNEVYSSVASGRRYNWSHEASNPLEHKQEEFTPEDINILKSLLFNGEKVKWRYVSSKLSVITGRRATSTACCKKTKELFHTTSEKYSGSLGSSLPYVVHNAWDSIVEEDV